MLRATKFQRTMGGLSRQLNEVVEQSVTGRVDQHRMLAPNSLSLFATPESDPKTRVFESVGFQLRDEMNGSKQSR